MDEFRPRANSGSSAYRSPTSRARPGTRSPPATRGPPRSPAGPSSVPGGTPTAPTPTRRRSSSAPDRRRRPDARAGRDRAPHAPPRGRADDADDPHDDAPRRDPDLTPVAPTAKAIFFGASYHADYATILAAPATCRRSPTRWPTTCAEPPDRAGPWDVVDLRRLRCGDPAADALAAAFGAREIAEGWTLNVEREDVCPVVTLPTGADIDDYLATLGKKERHEIRRKVRRAEAVGESASTTRPTRSPTSRRSSSSTRSVGRRRPLPADTPGGDQSRVLLPPPVRAARRGRAAAPVVPVGRRPADRGRHPLRDAATATSTTTPAWTPRRATCRPACSWSTPTSQRALAAGVRRLDFLRGNEPYKYEWGAVDEPIQRLLVRREGRLTMSAPAALGSLPRRRSSGRRCRPAASPRRRGPRDRHQRRRPGAPVLAGHPARPGALRRLGRVAVGRQRRPQAPARRGRGPRHR